VLVMRLTTNRSAHDGGADGFYARHASCFAGPWV